MKTILVTGGIASGKSMVCGYLASKGYPVYDSDSRTKLLYRTVPGLAARVEAAAGVPLSGLSAIFDDAAMRERVEAVVHPLVFRDFVAWRDGQDAGMVFFESAIALQNPLFDSLWDEVWLVKAPMESRLKRNPKVAERLSAQQEVPEARATRIITNEADLGSLYSQIDNILKQY